MSEAPETKPNTTPEESVEKTSDDALESFLSRTPEPDKKDEPPKKKTKLSRGSIALIIAIIVVAILAAVAVIVANQPVTADPNAVPPIVEAQLATTVDEKGEHHVEIPTDEEGEIKQNGYGDLVSYVPADIVTIEVENTAGSFTVSAETPDGESTVYTISGFEGYDLRTGIADAVANDAATLSFTSIAAVGGNLADFGLDRPRANVHVTYTDGTSAHFRIGNEADGGVGTYATLGDNSDVFLVSNDSVDSFFYSVLEFISYDITPAAENVDQNSFSVIEISGARYDDPITLVPNTDTAFKNNFRLTAPYEMLADNYEGNDIAGTIRDLYAESVVCVNPSANQLSEYGVAEPYAAVHAVYPDVEINLACSKATDDGLVNLYNADKGIIYTIRDDALGWANTSLELLLPKTVIELNKEAVSGITVTSASKDYTFEVSTTKKTVDNQEATVTTAKLNGKRIPEDSFNIFFQNLSGMKNLGAVNESGTNIVYIARVRYNNGRSEDTIAVYDTGSNSCPVALNGILIGSVAKSHVTALQKDVVTISDGKIPNNL